MAMIRSAVQRIRWGAGIVLLVALGCSLATAQDLRDQFGTRSTAAARYLNDAIELVQQKKPEQALPLFDKCVAEDPQLQLAYYWKALAYTDLGEIEPAIKQYEKIVLLAEDGAVSNVTIDACVNAGLTLAGVKQEKESVVWFTRAIVLDPDDKFDLRWKAFRNMAIGRREAGDHLSAAFGAMAAYSANPRRVGAKMVVEFLSEVKDGETARVLDFGQSPPKITARSNDTPLTGLGAVKGLSGKISQLAVDPVGQRVLATAAGSERIYVIDCRNENAATEVTLSGPTAALAVAGGRVFVAIERTGLVEVELPTGKVVKTWPIKGAMPTSLAVLPSQGVALFPFGNVLTVLDLESGNITPTEYVAHAVAADPGEQFCYTFARPEAGPQAGHVIINGRPYFIQRSNIDWMQSALFKYAIVNKRPLPAELRMAAASNGRRLVLSPEGDFVAVVGGGGWRPESPQGHKAGYGVAAFTTASFQQALGFYATGAYPSGAAFNPVTRQIAVVREEEAKIYDLAREESGAPLRGKFSGVAAWSPDGKYLYLGSTSDVQVWQNELSEKEAKVGVTWAAPFEKIGKAKKTKQTESPIKPLAEYANFAIQEDTAAVREAIQIALAQANAVKPKEWLQDETYQANPVLRAAFREIAAQKDATDVGLRIYRLKKLKAEHANHAGIDFLLGMSYYMAGQVEKSTESHLAAIHSDLARTNITLESLRCLGQIQKRNGKPAAAAYCYAHVLRLDRDNPLFVREASDMFKQANALDAAQELLASAGKAGATRSARILTSSSELPSLPVAADAGPADAEKLFRTCAASVVMIRTSNSSGSGVCIAEGGIVVTNRHVVGEHPERLKIYTFEVVDEKALRSEPLEAEVLFESEVEDLAFLRLNKPPKSLTPIPLRREVAAAGAKVFAIGSPGLGGAVLEQSISEGIISAAGREIAGQRYVQHTAAVNPGNSGGPLLDERGVCVALVTLKASLEGVSFAIPAAQIREIYNDLRASNAKQKP